MSAIDPDRRPPRVAVVGAGISGLAAAHRIRRLLPSAAVTVYDAADRAGGKIRTSDIDGMQIDEGADAFLARSPAAVGLCRELGLGDELVTPSERRAFVYRHGALRRFPEHMVLGVPTEPAVLRGTGLLSDEAIARLEEDLRRTTPLTGDGTGPGHGDESVGALVRRHVGDEVFDAFVGPLLAGVHAGDADQLSAAAATPQFVAAVREHGGLVRGLRAQREAAAASAVPDAPIFYGLRGGTQRLTDALATAIGQDDLLLDSPVVSVRRTAAKVGWSITTAGRAPRTIDDIVDAVVLATPAPVTADLLARSVPDVAEELRRIEYAGVALVTFAVRREDVAHPLDGSGFLVSEGEGLLMTACSFGSSKWRHWTNERGDVVLRVSAGRHHDGRAMAMDDDELATQLLAELRSTIGLEGAPLAVRVSRYPQGLPQFRPGHLERAASWNERVRAAAPGLHLTGACYFGLGIPACITDADRTAHELEAWWSRRG